MTEIIFEEYPGKNGSLGLITLNRPHALNALSHSMLLALDHQLQEWAHTNTVKGVIIRATPGRAFSAGGDIRSAYEKKITNDPTLIHFFRDEYRLNRRIFHYPKPYIALLNGITMGGGAGISMHGSHRVATERLIFAMPETSIGFFPDIGATYFLSRLPSSVGIYIGLTSVRLNAGDCYRLGLMHYTVESDTLNDLLRQLADIPFQPRENIHQSIQAFQIELPTSEVLEHQEHIAKCFSHSTVEEILEALITSENTWCKEQAAILQTKSPLSLKITLQAIQEGAKKNFDECMQMEYRLTCRFIQNHDFFEGIRAAVIDKDQKPKWSPATLAEVSTEVIADYFAPLTEELV